MTYWLIINGERIGPLTLEEALAHPALTPHTPVWHDGMDDWAEAALLPELNAAFRQPEPMPFNRPVGRPRPDLSQPMPPTYLVLAIITTICCCLLTGIIAIVYSSQVSTAFYRGDYARAKHSSEMALIWVIVSFVIGLIFLPFYFLFVMLSTAMAL